MTSTRNESGKYVKTLAYFVSVVLAVLLGIAGCQLFFVNKIYPGVKVAGVSFSGLSKESANLRFNKLYKPSKVELIFEDQKFEIPTESFALKYNSEDTLNQAFSIGRRGTLANSIQERVLTTTQGLNLPLSFILDENLLDQSIGKLTKDINVPSATPSASIKNGGILVNSGKDGREVDVQRLKKELQLFFLSPQEKTLSVPVNIVAVQMSDDQVENYKKTAKLLIGKQLTLNFEDKTFVYKNSDLVNLLDFYTSNANRNKVDVLTESIAKDVNKSAEDARFAFENGKVVEFNPAIDGVEVNKQELAEKIIALTKDLQNQGSKELTIDIPTDKIKPQKSTSDVNNLGIKELIGRGKSSFRGSIPNRAYNIALATKRLNGILIKPGEEFSFNNALGDVSVYTGYQQAYVIKEGKTVLGDGGGVCQVSTTFFRAALEAGLPITERHGHSYRVSYYEQDTKPGIDATVYPPYADLRIKNDTPSYILVQTKVNLEKSTLVFEFYGTSDGRKSEISNFKTWGLKDPPPALYQDDPTLPVGTTKQTEHAIKGIKTSFDYKVVRSDEVLQDRVFYTNYRAWQAVYLRGTGGQ